MGLRKRNRSSRIAPHSSFDSPTVAVDFPAVKALFHADDYVAGSLTWASRHGGLVMTLSAPGAKDADGVYTLVANNSIVAVSGTMPTPTKYVVAVAIGRFLSSGTAGLQTYFGGTTVGAALATSGYVYDTSPGQIANNPTLTGTISNGRKACEAAYWDMLDTSSPDIFAVKATSGTPTDQTTSSGSGTTYSTLQILLGGALESTMDVRAFGAVNDGRRVKVLALLDFASAMTLNELKLASSEMARTQELFAGWTNRVAA